MSDPAFTIGIEEEYHLVRQDSRDLATEPPAGLLFACEARLEGRVRPEFLRSQIEVATNPSPDVATAIRDLAALRRTVAEEAAKHGLAPIAASTHPFAQWDLQKPTQRDRYALLARDLQTVGRRLVICGMHVHVGIEDEELRIDLMNQAAYFLPHLLALSTSSPFWRGQPTGLKSYRISVFNELPRTGLPEYFASWGEYQRHVNALVSAGLIEDASKLWWDVRPSARFPTLEMRITDVCTRLAHAGAVAALWQCLLRHLWRLRRANQRWRIYARMLVSENRWRAQRYGIDEGLVDFGKGAIIPYAGLLDELIELLRDDAEALGCLPELLSARNILQEGTSAHRQLAIYDGAKASGASHEEALVLVVDGLIEETRTP
jgi:carboxylate-amine ligase